MSWIRHPEEGGARALIKNIVWIKSFLCLAIVVVMSGFIEAKSFTACRMTNGESVCWDKIARRLLNWHSVKDFIGTKSFTALELWQNVKDFTRDKTLHRTGGVATVKDIIGTKLFTALVCGME